MAARNLLFAITLSEDTVPDQFVGSCRSAAVGVDHLKRARLRRKSIVTYSEKTVWSSEDCFFSSSRTREVERHFAN